MSPARSTPPSISVFLAGAGARITRAAPPLQYPYVTPGSVGYLGSLGALTPYSPPGSGLPGAGNLPGVTWTWETYGLRNDDTNFSLDHVYVYGGIYWTGTGTATTTSSIVTPGTGTELGGLACHGAGGAIVTSDTTWSWMPGMGPDPATDLGMLFDVGSLPFTYSVLRCAISGSPQGLGPLGASGNSIVNSVISVTQNNLSVPNHLDGIFNEGANNTLIQGCWVQSPISSDATSALFWQSSGPITGCVVENNFLIGGSYTLYNENATGLIVTNNTFGGGFNGDAANISGDGGTIGYWANNYDTNGTLVPSP